MENRKLGVRKLSAEKKQFKTIVLVNLQDELLDRSLLQNHFSKYGEILKMHVSQKNKNAVISFSKSSEAKAAKEQGGLILPNKPPVKMFYTEKGLEGGRSRPLMRTISAIKPPSAASSMPSATPSTSIQAPSTSSALKPSPIKVAQSVKPIPSLLSTGVAHPPLPHGDRDQHSFYPDTPEAQELFAKRAVTAEEKYRLLEARDKIIRARNPKVKMRVEFAVKLSGTCRDMCPEKERYMREVQRQLTSYEITPTTGRDSEVDHRLAVKAYARSSADQEEPLSHELRPSETLEMSMSYILHNIIPRMEQDDLANWYNFVWDRTRSIRKEITQQQLCDLRSVAMMEKCARFHIYCSSRLCELDRHAFDMKLNDENLMKCLQSLEHMYTDLNLMGISCPNEPEFRAYQILMNLNEGDILWEIQQKPDWVRTSSHVQFAVKIHMAMFEKNYAQFFKLVLNAPYLTACILHRYFFQVRSTALRTIFKAYSIHNKSENYTSLSAVQRVLGFAVDKPNLFQYFCSSHRVSCDFKKDRITLSKKTFEMPDCPSITREYYLIESKLHEQINVILNGGPLGKNPYPNHCPHTSFDEQGYLIPGELIGVPVNKSRQHPQPHQHPPEPKVSIAHVHPHPHPSPAPPTTTSSLSLSTSSSSQQLSDFSWTLPAPTAIPSTTITSAATIFPTPLPVPAPVGRFPFKPFPGGTGVSSGPSTGILPASMTAFAKPEPVFGSLATSGPSASGAGSSTSIFGGSFRGTTLPSTFDQSQNQKKTSMEPQPIMTPFHPLDRNHQLQEKKLKEEKLLKATESIYNQMLVREAQRMALNCHREAQMERHKKVQRELLLERTSHHVYSRLEQKVIEGILQMLLIRHRQVQLMLNRKCEKLAEKLVSDVVNETIAALSKSSFSQELKERENKIIRLNELMNRIRMRGWLVKWRKYAQKQKRERQIRLEEKLKELENFPSYQNTHFASSEEMLISWCGGLEEIPRVKSPTFSKLDHRRLSLPNKIGDGNKGSILPKRGEGEVDEAKEMEEFKRLVQLVNFPASSNMSQTSPASILSSWCRLQVDQETHSLSLSPNLVGGERDAKKRRLDFFPTEFVES